MLLHYNLALLDCRNWMPLVLPFDAVLAEQLSQEAVITATHYSDA